MLDEMLDCLARPVELQADSSITSTPNVKPPFQNDSAESVITKRR